MELFQDILDKKHPCDEVTYATIINGFCKAGKTGEAFELLKKMCDDKRIRPPVSCFSPVIDFLSKEARVDEALSLFKQMINLGFVPDVVTYTSLVHGLCKLGRWEEPLSVLIDSLFKEDKIKEEISLFELMTKERVETNVVMFSSLISALCKSSRSNEAAEFLDSMYYLMLSPTTLQSMDCVI
ncbi:Pentatricopeptide repeat [Parasponia andersonii]|uniref:Pentatricopeptide repeat n=1 Tax=Parasponia andersonii TaxID=3476 RepID=A0A2P5CRZ6_PARAD|nr:Pentatricopeptide repeat [Parasponia andersonii]